MNEAVVHFKQVAKPMHMNNVDGSQAEIMRCIE